MKKVIQRTESQTPPQVITGKAIFSCGVVLSFCLCYGACSPDLDLLDYASFNKMKEPFCGRKFPTNSDLERGVCGSVRSIPNDSALLLSKSYQRDGNGTQTSVGIMSKVPQCDLLPVVSRRLVTERSVNHLCTTLIH
jgi:hypothetical protein